MLQSLKIGIERFFVFWGKNNLFYLAIRQFNKFKGIMYMELKKLQN